MAEHCTLDEFNERIKEYGKICLTQGRKNIIIACLTCNQEKLYKNRDISKIIRSQGRCQNCINLKSIEEFKQLVAKENYKFIEINHLNCKISCIKCNTEKYIVAGKKKILKCKKCLLGKKHKALIDRPPNPQAIKNITDRGGTFIKKEIINAKVKGRKNGYNSVFLTIICANNHEFKSHERSIIVGNYCRLCSVGMAEAVFRLALNIFTDHTFLSAYIKTDRQRTSLYQLDAFCVDLKLNIEVHGVQHYQFHKFFHTDYNDFLKQKRHDRKKFKYLKQNGIKCLSIKDKEVTKAIREGTLKNLIIKILKKTRKKNLIPINIDSRILDLKSFFENRTFADSFISIKKKYPGQNIWDLIEYKKRDKIRENRKTKSGDGYKLIHK